MRRARLEILGAAALFSTGGVAIKAASVSGWQVACLRSAIAFVALFLFLPEVRRGWRPIHFGVGLCYAATLILFVTSTKLTTSANAIFLQSTDPIYLLLLGPWLLHERVRPRDLAFLVALGGGLALFFLDVNAPQATAPQPRLGNLLAVACSVTWAFTLVGLRHLGRRSASGGDDEGVRAATIGNLIAALVALPFAWPIPALAPRDLAVLGYLGVFQIGLAYWLFSRGLRHVPALEAALLVLIEPVLNPLWVFLLQGERPGRLALAGGAVILAATAAHTLAASRGETPTSTAIPS